MTKHSRRKRHSRNALPTSFEEEVEDEKTISKYIWIGSCVMAVIVLGGAGIFYVVSSQANGTENVTPQIVNSTTATTAKLNPTTRRPKPIVLPSAFLTDCNRPYVWIKDVDIPGTSEKLNLFDGIVTHSIMERICRRIGGGMNTLVFKSAEEENVIDQLIRQNHEDIFGNVTTDAQLKLWMGHHFKKDWDTKKWSSTFHPNDKYRNFCNESKVIEAQKPTWWFFVGLVKNFQHSKMFDEDDPACWDPVGRFTEDERILMYPEPNPGRYPFVCKSKGSGRFGVPGNFRQKIELKSNYSGIEYTFYPTAATFAEAVEECRSGGSRLVTINSGSKYEDVKQILQNTTSFLPPGSNRHSFWTGGYYDMLADDPRQVQWFDNAQFNKALPPDQHFCDDRHKNKDYFNEPIKEATKKDLTDLPNCKRRRYIHIVITIEWEPKEVAPKKQCLSLLDSDVIRPESAGMNFICERVAR